MNIHKETEGMLALQSQLIAALDKIEKMKCEQEPLAFKIYLPKAPRQDVNHGRLPWVYDQDPSSGNVASMWVTPVKATSPPQRQPLTLDCYDAGLLSDFGGGNVDWWQDYIRAELDRAHGFYQSQAAHGIGPTR